MTNENSGMMPNWRVRRAIIQRLICRDALLHLLENPVRAGLGAEEDHGAAGALDGCKGLVRVARHDVYASLAPPPQIEVSHAITELPGMIFPKEEIHVVELDGVCAVALNEMREDGDGAFGRFELLLVAVSRMHTAEAAVEGAADAGMVDGGTLTEERRSQILLHRQPMEGRPGELVWALHRALAVIVAQAERDPCREALHDVEADARLAAPRISSRRVSSPCPRTT